MRPKNKYANVLYMSLTIAMGWKSVVVRAFFVFGSIWNIVLFQDDGISPVCKIWFMMPRRAVTTLSGAKCNNSATNPHSSEALFIFSRLMAHSTPVSSNLALSSAMVGLDYLDVHEKCFPTCLRNHWLEDVVRTVERWCATFSAAFSIGLACSATVEVLKISMHEAHVDAILQCQKIIVF